MSGLTDFAQLFGAAAQGVQGVTTGITNVTDETVRTEQKLQQTIDQAKEGIAAYGVATLVFQGITAFGVLYLVGRLSKRRGS
jgi:hypothetical protein